MNLIRGVPPREAREGELVALDIEMFGQTEPLHLPTGRLACLSVAMGDDVWQVYDLQRFRETIKRIRKGKWAFHNAMYDIRQMKRYAEVPILPLWDTYLVEKHLYAGYFTTTYGLADLARRYLNIEMEKEVRDLFSTATEMTPEMEQYAATDAWVTLRIAEKQMEQKRLGVDFRSYEIVNAPAIWAIEAMDPVRVDPDGWMALAQRLGDEDRTLQAGLTCNVNSPGQVKAYVQSLLGREIKNSKRETLELLAGDANDDTDGGRVELKHIMRARTMLKMESTYGASFLETLQPGSLLLPGWKVDGADTGRMACGEPNFHNVPVRDLPDFRYAVLARDGNKFIVSDASQQEPRVGAVLTQDPELLRLVKTGESIYIMVASVMMGMKITKKHPHYDAIKAVVLGTFYGLTPTGLAKRERISRKDAQKLQATFFNTFKRVTPWMEEERKIAYSRNYVETLLGRRLWVNIYNNQWQNNAVNNPIQGTAAEITKLALAYMFEESRARGWPYCIVLQIHDELNADCPATLVPEYKQMMDDCWKEAGKVIIPQVPFVTEFAVGNNWGCKK